ncbi:MAG: tetratricopeptide repeat protein [Acidobacteriota bacterium]
MQQYEDGLRALRHNYDPANIDRAVDIFQRLLEREPESAAAHAGLARAFWEMGRNPSAGGDQIFIEQAVAVARDAVRLDGYLADARVSLGLTSLLAGRNETARSELETALDLEPTNADAQFGLARLEQVSGNAEAAERHYRRAIELEPAPVYLDALGGLLYAAGRYDEAEATFVASLDLAPDGVYALRNLGVVYFARGQIDEAAVAFQKALKIRPDASLYSNLGTIFFSRGLYPKAAAAFEDALRVDGASNNASFWINLADAYRQIDGKEDAMDRSYRQAIRLLDARVDAAPEDIRLRSLRALARARNGEVDAARRDLRQIDVAGSDLYSLLRIAMVEELVGDRDAALGHLDAALRAGLSVSEVRREPDLLSLRADPRFHHLLLALDAPPSSRSSSS